MPGNNGYYMRSTFYFLPLNLLCIYKEAPLEKTAHYQLVRSIALAIQFTLLNFNIVQKFSERISWLFLLLSLFGF